MTRNLFLGVLGFSLLALGVAILFTPERETPDAVMPWQIEILPDGGSRVFGITLGKTTLAQAEARLRAAAEVTLFVSPEGQRIVEAYFDKVTLGGLSAKMIAGFDLDEALLDKIYQRGRRISTLGSGTRKVTLSHADLEWLGQQPITTLTYLPGIDLGEEQVKHRFGEPEQRIVENGETPLVHFLYPRLGLDITLSDRSKDILQYVLPRDFERLSAPLQGH